MFMQNNSLSSANELRRSGRLVYKKTLFLGKDPSKDLHKWENYSIDLAGLIHQEPGAIYRVILSFKQEYSAYPCGSGENPKMQFSEETESLTKVKSDILSEEDEAVWDKPKHIITSAGMKMPTGANIDGMNGIIPAIRPII